MYTQKISIENLRQGDMEELIEAFILLMKYYRGNGQIIGKIQSEYVEKQQRLVSLPYTLEKDALSSQYNNVYVNKQIEAIEKMSGAELIIEIMGQLPDLRGTELTNSTALVLKTDYATVDSPVICAGRGWSLPLYKLPDYYDFGYMPILSWETNYKACDDLFMNGDVGERWALNQLQNPSSALSVQGRAICSKIEALTEKPTYYYLFNYRAKDSLVCPVCSEVWVVETDFADFDFKCDNCRLVSNRTAKS